MRTLRSAADALAGASTLETLGAVASGLGSGPFFPLDDATRAALALNEDVAEAKVAAGAGAIRFLLLRLGAAGEPGAAVGRIAARVAARAPHRLWLILALSGDAHWVVLAASATDRTPPRVAALIARRDRVLDSDAETLRALAAARVPDDLATHARWMELLGRDGLTRRFYRLLAAGVDDLAMTARGRAPDEARRELALLAASRLLFLGFLEAKGWLDGDRAFLQRVLHAASARGDVHRRLLLPLFFGTLNAPAHRRAAAARAFGRIPFLNGGLFARTALERRHRDLRFDDAAIGMLFGEVLGRFRFTAREDAITRSEAAIDPEMLGRAFESLMASDDRRSSGSFYTPAAVVERVTTAALIAALGDDDRPATIEAAAELLRGVPIEAPLHRRFAERIAALRVLDPACGSGAFLVHALDVLAALRVRLGDPRQPDAIRRDVLARSIFGVDRSAMAVWLCELRLWLATVIETEVADPARVPPLPNLDHHIVAGDALMGGDFGAAPRLAGGAALAVLRRRYAGAVGHRKRTLGRAIERAGRRFALLDVRHAIDATAAARRDLLAALRTRDLFGDLPMADGPTRARLLALRSRARDLRARARALERGDAPPFSFASRFPDVARSGGFDVVIGNPPWVRLHRIPRASRAALRRDFAAFRDAAWTRGAIDAHAGPGFAAQVDLAALFLERALTLARRDGAVSLLLPAKLWRSLAGGGIRRLLLERNRLVAIEDWSAAPAMFEAVTYPSLVVARAGTSASAATAVAATVHRGETALAWTMPAAGLSLDDQAGSPWLLLPAEVRRAFDRLRVTGPSLASSALGRPLLGVKCGLNDAFVVDVEDDRCDPARVRSPGRDGEVERSLLRPVIRGEQIRPWRCERTRERIVWTHGADGAPLPSLPPRAARWLGGWRADLERRADARHRSRWWSLFRTEAASSDRPRVVWCDVGRSPRAVVLPAGDSSVPLNTCYVIRTPERDDALALAALLNSPLAAAWLNAIAEPASGGYHRYLGWTVSLLPIPRDWPRARAILAPIAAREPGADPPAPSDLMRAVCRAWRVRERDVAPLVEWLRD